MVSKFQEILHLQSGRFAAKSTFEFCFLYGDAVARNNFRWEAKNQVCGLHKQSFGDFPTDVLNHMLFAFFSSKFHLLRVKVSDGFFLG